VNPSELEGKVDELSRRLTAIERRLAALESSGAPGTGVAGAESAAEGEPGLTATRSLTETTRRTETLPLIGRTLLVLAGAFLLRAVTESGALPQTAGVFLGLAYAVVWLVLAGRAGGRGQSVSASFYGLAGAIIAFPLVWEATVKFELLSPTVSAAIVIGVTLAGLAVAGWRGLAGVAWVFALAGAATMLALGVATNAVVPFVAPLLLLGLVTLWLGYERGRPGPGWAVAAIADASVLVLGSLVLTGHTERVWEVIHPETVVTLQLALVLIYCGSFGARTLARRTDVGAAEIAQGTAALIVGLGGAIAVSHITGIARGTFGVVTLVLALGCYAAAFAFIDRHGGGRRNFIFFSTLALVFTLVTLDALLEAGAFSWTLAVLAIVTAWLGAVRARATLTLHGAVYGAVAAVGSGLLATAVEAMAASQAPTMADLTPARLMVLTAAAICAWLPVATHGRTWGGFSRAPKLVVLIVLVLGVGAVIVTSGAAVAARSGNTALDPAVLAALRTAVLAVAALGLAWAGRFERFVEARWLVYPVLVAGGAKLLLEDVAAGRAATLVLSFALYGGALIAAPRLARRAGQASPGEPESR